ncbi:MAG: hypothetical protein WCG81_14085 [Candidatus Angelobacter sp.]
MSGSAVVRAVLAGVALIGLVMTGRVASSSGAELATLLTGSEAATELLVVGCPQFVQKPVPCSSLLPQFVQKAVDELTGAASAADGAEVAAGAASATGTGSAFSRLPHSVQKTEPGSVAAPHEEQTGRATVTAAEGCAAVGIGLPHDVQKLADSCT